jgi:hypothetical protein
VPAEVRLGVTPTSGHLHLRVLDSRVAGVQVRGALDAS